MKRDNDPNRQLAEATGTQWVVLADKSPIVASGLQFFFGDTQFLLIERVSSSNDLQRLLGCHEVHVVISDLEIDDASLDDLVGICKQHRKPHVLFSSNANPACLGRAYRAGVAGWINKSASRAELIQGLRLASSGKQFWTRKQTRQIIGSFVARELTDKLDFPLTDRELEVLRLVSAGHSNQKIADRLHIGFETVKEHVQRILAKLGVNDRTQAAVLAERNDLL